MIIQPEACHSSYNARPRHHLFFAIMVPPLAATQIATCFDNLRMRYPFSSVPISQDRLHLSLTAVFAGNNLPDRVIRISEITGSAIRFVEFDITLERALTYQNRQVKKPFVITTRNGSSTINQLVLQIRRTLSILSGNRNHQHRPVSPHVTLVWDRVVVPEHPIEPVTLPVQEIALVHSHVGQSRYDILGRWPLVPKQ